LSGSPVAQRLLTVWRDCSGRWCGIDGGAEDLMRGFWRKTTCLLASLFAMVPHVMAAEVTLRMRGGAFEVKGELKSYNLKTYVITSPGL